MVYKNICVLVHRTRCLSWKVKVRCSAQAFPGWGLRQMTRQNHTLTKSMSALSGTPQSSMNQEDHGGRGGGYTGDTFR